jgi:hypothetical protein
MAVAAHGPSIEEQAMKSLLIAILGAATLSLTAGCTGIEVGEIDIEPSAGRSGGPSDAPQSDLGPVSFEEPCADIWGMFTAVCDCPPLGEAGYTPQCTYDDCLESEIYALTDSGDALRVTVRYTAAGAHLSAIGFGADEGTWTYGDGELTLDLESGQAISRTECSGELLTMGEYTLKFAGEPLAGAILWAWDHGQWLDVPYEP